MKRLLAGIAALFSCVTAPTGEVYTKPQAYIFPQGEIMVCERGRSDACGWTLESCGWEKNLDFACLKGVEVAK